MNLFNIIAMASMEISFTKKSIFCANGCSGFRINSTFKNGFSLFVIFESIGDRFRSYVIFINSFSLSEFSFLDEIESWILPIILYRSYL